MNWLREAQVLPVGRSKWIRHGHCNKDNLILHNKPDRWSALCMWCGWYAQQMKEVRQAKSVAAPKPRELPIDLTADVPEDVLASRLYRYGLQPAWLFDWKLKYSPGQRRLYFINPVTGEFASRPTTPDGQPKWLHSTTSTLLKARANDDFTIVCEDLLSAFKLYAVCGKTANVLCSHGVLMNREAKRVLVLLGCPVVLAYDGDDAGRQAVRRTTAEVSPFLDVRVFRVPDGADPKDMSMDHINEEYKRVIANDDPAPSARSR